MLTGLFGHYRQKTLMELVENHRERWDGMVLEGVIVQAAACEQVLLG
jgi:hypothetical protein